MSTRAWVVSRCVRMVGLFTTATSLGLASQFCARVAHAQDQAVFWRPWSDGNAELDGYELRQPRYGALRDGRAILIYVTEPFSRSNFVKVDSFDASNRDHFIALKLNHVRKFQTGIYDYSVMISTFVDPAADFRPVKTSFSSQEWCGNLYQQLIFTPSSVREQTLSYFEGESVTRHLPGNEGLGTEDDLLIRVRSLGRSDLPSGTSEVRLLRSSLQSRLLHRPIRAFDGSLARTAEAETVAVPAGEFAARRVVYTREDGYECTYWVEETYPHRVVSWRCSDGETARLTGSTRLDYWRTNGEGDESYLERLGLTPLGVRPQPMPASSR